MPFILMILLETASRFVTACDALIVLNPQTQRLYQGRLVHGSRAFIGGSFQQ
jgi:hypothetical protein